LPYDDKIIEDFALELKSSESDTLVLFILRSRGRPVAKTRLQKEALIFNRAYGYENEHEAYHFGGYSDDIDESYSTLSDVGIISSGSNGMTLTNFGRTVADRMASEKVDSDNRERTELLEKAIGHIDDRSLVAVTYHLFPELAEESVIRGPIRSIIDTAVLNSRPLKEWTADEFLECVRNGIPMTFGRVTA